MKLNLILQPFSTVLLLNNFKLRNYLILFALYLVTVSFANAATFTVTRTDDRNAICVTGDCSLREAIVAAKATFDNDVIDFSTGLGLITLANEIEIQVPNGTISINGGGANVLTIDGGSGNNRIFSTIFATLNISGVTLTEGNGIGNNRSGFGGAVHVDGGSLNLDGVYVTRNTTGSAGGGLSVEGGGVLRILNSTISDNTAFNCGGLTNGGSTIAIANSTISGNTASQQGGGLCANDKLRFVR